ncbi:UDP-N-acetylmuramate dehydrogenase [Motiliproteus sp. MSK22-1]|uniref:UDP-N-acetylmuramate dehydrogenase n=1 Tax=Motiliproteus sp. MSK22-1 TaxID=1897630 RepID=UPI00097883FE|nr:UDP-N-acetylmuramate dehydrogenase [Motiliproteus sp. MSK22-1]OMH25253.1 UDP-N-acetylenolpyruvoylglucosamine reductase [Motiliproteus sp. MSK22-1]
MGVENAVLKDVSLRSLNTLGLSVKARYFESVTQSSRLQELLAYAKDRKLPVMILGGGSNVILRDDFPGLCIQMATQGVQFSDVDEHWMRVTAQSGESWHEFVIKCLAKGCFGLENLALIPGTVGAAPIQNIGAYGVEIKDYMYGLQALDRRTLEFRHFTVDECKFAYRDSVFKRTFLDQFVITEVSFRLRKKPQLQLNYGGLTSELAEISSPGPQDLFEAVVKLRSSKLPDPALLANVGSFFKNPVVSKSQYEQLKRQHPGIIGYNDPQGVKLAAGWMIDTAGWKGFRKGSVGVHDKQALVLVNYNQAEGAEVLELAGLIQADIASRFGVELEIEPRIY